jgi:hypothetical protein
MLIEQPLLLAQIVEVAPLPVDLERARRMRGVLTEMSLRDEKVLFEATRYGVDGSPWSDIALALDARSPEAPSRIH